MKAYRASCVSKCASSRFHCRVSLSVRPVACRSRDMKNIAIYRDICLARELQMSYLIAIFAKVVEIKDKDICQKSRDNIA